MGLEIFYFLSRSFDGIVYIHCNTVS